jgi:hypothetical protein
MQRMVSGFLLCYIVLIVYIRFLKTACAVCSAPIYATHDFLLGCIVMIAYIRFLKTESAVH